MNPNASIFDPTYIDYFPPDYGYMGTYDDQNADPINEGGYFHVSSFSEPNQPPDKVTSLCFDKSEEIIWTGTSTNCIIFKPKYAEVYLMEGFQ